MTEKNLEDLLQCSTDMTRECNYILDDIEKIIDDVSIENFDYIKQMLGSVRILQTAIGDMLDVVNKNLKNKGDDLK